MARTCHRLFGTGFPKPSSLVLRWTAVGAGEGGTGQPIRMARSLGIPVIDLGAPKLDGTSADEVVERALDETDRFRARRGLSSPSLALDALPDPG